VAYAKVLRHLLARYSPSVEDLYLLEPFQVASLPDRAPAAAMAAVMHGDPLLRSLLSRKDPGFAEWAQGILDEHGPTAGTTDELLWEIADLLVAVADPSTMDSASGDVGIEAITECQHLHGVVVDVGAGTGRLAMAAARHADVVFAVEPVGRLRDWIRSSADRMGLTNVYVVDGFLDKLPFRDDSVDVLITRRALGWRPNAELREVDRVLAPGGGAVHLTGLPVSSGEDDLHRLFEATGYRMAPYRDLGAWCRRYVK
jgi:SAM-dependent methyltransferase